MQTTREADGWETVTGLLETNDTYGRPPRAGYALGSYTYDWSAQGYTLGGTIDYVHFPPANPGPGTKKLLLLHGHSSSVHEFDDLYDYLGDFDVYSFDQPCCGTSSEVHIDGVEGYATHQGYPTVFACLHFLRDLTKEFVNHVVQPCGSDLYVAGGSLGGNVALWVAEDNPPWLTKTFVWSPGSAWPDDVPLKPQAIATLDGWAKSVWTRDTFLAKAFGRLPCLNPQPWYWYWDCWAQWCSDGSPCQRTGSRACALCQQQPGVPGGDGYPGIGARKAHYIESAYAAVGAAFTNTRARWHWRVAREEVQFTHQANIQRVGSPVVFIAGDRDDDPTAGLFEPTRELFRKVSATLTPTRGLGLTETGHSVHNERPVSLAAVLNGAP